MSMEKTTNHKENTTHLAAETNEALAQDVAQTLEISPKHKELHEKLLQMKRNGDEFVVFVDRDTRDNDYMDEDGRVTNDSIGVEVDEMLELIENGEVDESIYSKLINRPVYGAAERPKAFKYV